ncbi:hypothetical protein TWF694_003221 [Orbilia ellipsospora]|uniref:Rhodopsin domain-containing protein n=1 Tax=Orbilia ellipsospora TaxID=2528407 RepID=A0AAV9X6Z9_9PEZI
MLLNSLIWICITFTLIGALLNFFWCKPLYAFWTPMPIPMMQKYCSIDVIELSVYMYSAYNIVTDICIMIVPYFLLSHAGIQSRGQKIALFALFGMGAFVIASTVIKVVAIAQPKNFEPPELVLWSFIEACVAIVVVCLPSLPPLIWKNSTRRQASMATLDDILEGPPQVNLSRFPSIRLAELFSSVGLERRGTDAQSRRKKSTTSSMSKGTSMRSKLAMSDYS